MKNNIMILLIALFLYSCSSDNADIIENDTLTSACISANTGLDETSSRAAWSNPKSSSGSTNPTITVTFENGEKFDLFEQGYEDIQVFTCSDPDNYQSGNFSGRWHKDGTRWAAVLPSECAEQVSMNSDNNNNIYTLTLPSTQQTKVDVYEEIKVYTTETTYCVSPDPKANIMIGAQNDHNNSAQTTATASCFLAPICTYLYFATSTDISRVTVSCEDIKTYDVKQGSISDGIMTGTVEVTTNGEWNSWGDFTSCIKGIKPSSGSNSITVTAAETNRSGVGRIHEYIVCLYSGTYTGLTLKNADTDQVIASSSKSLTFETVNLYFLGKIDATTSAKENIEVTPFDITE